MALGVGATTAIYSVIDATLLRPLPYPNPAQLVRVVDAPTDVPTFAGVTLILTTVALAASYIPALRAMRLDPVTTLQSG